MSGEVNTTVIPPHSQLYLHPSEGTNSVQIEKLDGTNWRSWSKKMEITLSAKRKLGFITGAVKRDKTDQVKQEAWDACNDMVVAWIINNLSDSIQNSIMYSGNAHQIWSALQKRFQVAHGARKYQLNKDLYETKQNEKSVVDYYTSMSDMGRN